MVIAGIASLIVVAAGLRYYFSESRSEKLTQLGENILQVSHSYIKEEDWKYFRAGAFSIHWPLTATSDPDIALQVMQQFSAQSPGALLSIDFFTLSNERLSFEGALEIFNLKNDDFDSRSAFLSSLQDIASQLGDGKPDVTEMQIKVPGLEQASRAKVLINEGDVVVYGFAGKAKTIVYKFIILSRRSALSESDFDKVLNSIKVSP